MNGIAAIKSELVKLDGDLIQKLFAIEEGMKGLPQVELNHKHYFSKGLYGREMTMPKGTMAIGRLHRFSQINIISKGDVSILTENGWKRFQAPCTFESPAGVKRAAYTHEETVWTCLIATDETDLDNIEDKMTVGSYQEYIELKETLLIEEK